MSDVDDDVAGLGRQALRTARVAGLRRRMEAFLQEHDREVDLRELRDETSDGTPLGEFVDEGRNERV